MLGGVMPAPGRYGPPPVPPPLPGPIPDPVPSPIPVPCPVPAPVPLPGPWLSASCASARTPALSVVSAGAWATGATTSGKGFGGAGGGGSTGFATGSGAGGGGVFFGSGSGGRGVRGRGGGTGLCSSAAPFILAAGGGAGCLSPPPPPPPPGPGVARNTSRIWVVGSASGAATPIVNNRNIRRPVAWSAPDATSAPGERFMDGRAANMACSWLATGAPRSARTARIASPSATNRPRIVRTEPSAINARTSAVATPAAAAISRAVNTSGTVALMEDMVSLRKGQNACRAYARTGTCLMSVFGHYSQVLLSALPQGCAHAGTARRGRGHNPTTVSSFQFPVARTSNLNPISGCQNVQFSLGTVDWELETGNSNCAKTHPC